MWQIVTPHYGTYTAVRRSGALEPPRLGLREKAEDRMHLDRRSVSVCGGLGAIHPKSLPVEGMLGVQGDDGWLSATDEVVEERSLPVFRVPIARQ